MMVSQILRLGPGANESGANAGAAGTRNVPWHDTVEFIHVSDMG